MRKGICLVLCLVLALGAVGVVHAEEDIMLCYEYVSSINASLSISSGTAKAAGKVCSSNNLKTSITVRLQKKVVAVHGLLSLRGPVATIVVLQRPVEQRCLRPDTAIEFM